jgi:hypothetical protein
VVAATTHGTVLDTSNRDTPTVSQRRHQPALIETLGWSPQTV